jgi:hypothetical protein
MSLLADLVQDTLQVDRLGPLNGQAQCPVPDKLCEWAKAATDTERRGVVESFREAEVMEEDAGGRVDIGVGVLSLRSMLAFSILHL